MTALTDIPITDKNGTQKTLADFPAKAYLIVNTASKCGFTPQFEGLEKLNKRYQERGLVILGFPCNQFGKQDPGTQDEIESFCQINYGVSFTMMKKIDVNGDQAAPLFCRLKELAPGLLGSKRIKWNFTKFLINADGTKVRRFAPNCKPEALADDIERML